MDLTKYSTISSKLHAQLNAVAPIDSLSVGNWDDKQTWVINFNQSATQQQRTDAQAVVNAFDITAEKALIDTNVTRLDSFGLDAQTIDLLGRAANSSPAQIDTWLVNNVTNLTQARTVLGAVIKTLVFKVLR